MRISFRIRRAKPGSGCGSEVGQNDNGAAVRVRAWEIGCWLTRTWREVLKASGYHYLFVYAKEAGHVDRPVRAWRRWRPAAPNSFGEDYNPQEIS